MCGNGDAIFPLKMAGSPQQRRPNGATLDISRAPRGVPLWSARKSSYNSTGSARNAGAVLSLTPDSLVLTLLFWGSLGAVRLAA